MLDIIAKMVKDLPEGRIAALIKMIVPPLQRDPAKAYTNSPPRKVFQRVISTLPIPKPLLPLAQQYLDSATDDQLAEVAMICRQIDAAIVEEELRHEVVSRPVLQVSDGGRA